MSRSPARATPGTPARATAAGLAAVLLGGLAGCALLRPGDDAVRYSQDFDRHEPLRIEGYPSADALRLVQQVVWRLGDGSEGQLASLATGDSSRAEATRVARSWIAEFGGAARGRATAAFCLPGDGRQAAVVSFPATGQTLALHIRLDGPGGEDGWRVRLREPGPDESGDARLPACP